jgi:hypothetical protein
VLYWSFRQVQPHQSAGTGLYCAVLVVQTGTASPIRRYRAALCWTGRSERYSLTNSGYRAALCWTGRSERYSLTNQQVQGCSGLYRPFRPIGRYRTLLCCTGRSDRYSNTNRKVYRAVLCCTGRSDKYSLTNRQVQEFTVLYRPFRKVKAHQSAGTGMYCAVLAVQKVQAHQSAGIEDYTVLYRPFR